VLGLGHVATTPLALGEVVRSAMDVLKPARAERRVSGLEAGDVGAAVVEVEPGLAAGALPGPEGLPRVGAGAGVVLQAAGGAGGGDGADRDGRLTGRV